MRISSTHTPYISKPVCHMAMKNMNRVQMVNHFQGGGASMSSRFSRKYTDLIRRYKLTGQRRTTNLGQGQTATSPNNNAATTPTGAFASLFKRERHSPEAETNSHEILPSFGTDDERGASSGRRNTRYGKSVSPIKNTGINPLED
ncbi:hypothetical protein FGO68_gene1828 [Halteria grandinella]|uniref:Uncharacterized protein n=1 Tax=Halteria grandinella TaxID=5974 RepID=A0A8J8NLQ2_HALGN|nr:hypothetical protein FGO68_gene1828 [Halteria grandinella]